MASMILWRHSVTRMAMCNFLLSTNLVNKLFFYYNFAKSISLFGDLTRKTHKQQHSSERYKTSLTQETWTMILPEAARLENAIHCLLFWHYGHFWVYFVEDLKHRALAYINI